MPDLSVAPGPGGSAILSWASSDPAVVLQHSPTLGNWSVETRNITKTNDVNRFTLPAPTALLPRGYWRLRR